MSHYLTQSAQYCEAENFSLITMEIPCAMQPDSTIMPVVWMVHNRCTAPSPTCGGVVERQRAVDRLSRLHSDHDGQSPCCQYVPSHRVVQTTRYSSYTTLPGVLDDCSLGKAGGAAGEYVKQLVGEVEGGADRGRDPAYRLQSVTRVQHRCLTSSRTCSAASVSRSRTPGTSTFPPSRPVTKQGKDVVEPLTSSWNMADTALLSSEPNTTARHFDTSRLEKQLMLIIVFTHSHHHQEYQPRPLLQLQAKQKFSQMQKLFLITILMLQAYKATQRALPAQAIRY